MSPKERAPCCFKESSWIISLQQETMELLEQDGDGRKRTSIQPLPHLPIVIPDLQESNFLIFFLPLLKNIK